MWKRGDPVNNSLVDTRGQRMTRLLKLIGRQSNWINHPSYQSMQKSIPEQWSCRRPHRLSCQLIIVISSAKLHKKEKHWLVWWFLLQHSDLMVRIWCELHESMDHWLVSTVGGAGGCWHTLGPWVKPERHLNSTACWNIVDDYLTTVHPSQWTQTAPTASRPHFSKALWDMVGR